MLAIFWAIYYSNINVTWFCEYLFSPPYTHLWFLNALAFSKITLFFLRKALSDKQLLILLALLSLFAIVINQLNIGHNLLTIRNSLGSCFFVALGYYLRKNDDIFNILLKYSPFIFIPLICYLMLSKCDIPVFTAVIHVCIE